MLAALRTRPKVSGASSPPVAGYTSWYDPSNTATITSSGGNVTAVTDGGSAARNLTPVGTGPATGSRTINGLNVFDFPAADRRIQTATFTVTQPLTYFIVAQTDLTANTTALNAQMIRDNTGTQPSILAYSPGGTSRKWATWAGSAVQQSSTAMDNSAHVICAIFNGASSAIYLDGASVNTGNPGTNGFSAARFTLGDTGTWDGAIGEVITYTSALNSTNRASVEAYLKAKWGTP